MTGWIVLGAVALIILLLCILLLYWRFRRNGSLIDPSLRIETWEVIKDGRHNSNSHLIYWKEEFWLIHANSPYHFASVRCKLMLWKSKDAKAWAKVREFNIPGEDIRDPKFAEINGKLFIYVLKSVDLNPEPYATAYTWSADGFNWRLWKICSSMRAGFSGTPKRLTGRHGMWEPIGMSTANPYC